MPRKTKAMRSEPSSGDMETGSTRARGMWSGTIGFGLVSIPVQLVPAVRTRPISLRMLGPNGVPLRRQYYDPETGKALDDDDLVRGYETSEGEFVLVEDEDLEKIAVDKSRDIELKQFVDVSRIDPMYFERAYFLVPNGSSTKAYRLLAETMETTKRAGIATFVMREKEYPIAVLAENGILRAETLRFADEVRHADQVGLPASQQPKSTDVDHFVHEIQRLAAPSLKPSALRDEQVERLLEMCHDKLKQGEGVVRLPEAAPEESGENIVDLMNALKRSVKADEERRTATTARGRASAPRKGVRTGSTSGRKTKSPGARPRRTVPARTRA